MGNALAEKSRDIPELTGLRGLAAMMVVLHHANLTPIRDEPDMLAHLFLRGQPFVDLFFILSGFVMSHVYMGTARAIDWRAFAIARFARIYPLHLLTAVLALAGTCLIAYQHGGDPPPGLNFLQALREVTLTSAMPFLHGEHIWNSPSWSISVEWWAYVFAFPLLYAFRHCDNRALLMMIAFAIPGALAAILLSTDLEATRGGLAFARAVVGFCAGWAVWKLLTTGPVLRIPGIGTDLLFCFTIAAIELPPLLIHEESWASLALLPLLVFCLLSSSSATARLMQSKPAVFLGLISYSIYLLHPLVLKALELVTQMSPLLNDQIWFFLLTAPPVTIAVSYLCYAAFERPARNMIRDWTQARPKPTPQTAS